MEKRSKCQICNRYFSNPKALGGHMKSHYVKAPLAGAASQPPPPPGRDGFQVTQQSRNMYSHMQSNQDSVFIDKSCDIFADETTGSNDSTASPPHPPEAQSFVVSATSTSPEEDAAQCLVMLSRSACNKDHIDVGVGVPLNNYEDDHDDGCDDVYQEQHQVEEETLVNYSWADEQESCFVKPQAKYKCETCNKIFKSYQALGGHRSSHSNSDNLANHTRIFKCSYCPRVFDSGQALGGHKKVHGMCAKNSVDDQKSGMIDLNIPVQDREFLNDKLDSFISYDS